MSGVPRKATRRIGPTGKDARVDDSTSVGSQATRRHRSIGLSRQSLVFGDGLLTLLGLHAVEHEHTVQVIEFVLKESRLEFVGLERDLVSVDVDTGHENGFRSNHLDVQARDAEASLFVRPFAIGFGDHRVEDHFRFTIDVPDEDLTLDSHLWSRETDSRIGLVQRVEHLLDDPNDLAVDIGHLGSFGSQNRIAECSDFIGHTCQATCEMSHYFDPSPSAASRPRLVTVVLPDDAFDFETDHGVFSHGRLDTGTKYLLTDSPTPPDEGVFLDLGCGAGPIALALARRRPRARVIAVDVNTRARELTERNAHRSSVTNIEVLAPDEVDLALRFDLIWSNPPIKVGKAELHALLERWLDRLSASGRAVLVVHKNLGSDSLQKWLIERGHPTVRHGSRAGYRLLVVSPRFST